MNSMAGALVIIFLSILMFANLILFGVIAYSLKETKNQSKAQVIGFFYMAIVLLLDMFSLFGGYWIW